MSENKSTKKGLPAEQLLEIFQEGLFKCQQAGLNFTVHKMHEHGADIPIIALRGVEWKDGNLVKTS